MTSFLLYGPGAKEHLITLSKGGRMLSSPFGETGLKIEEARSIVELSNNLPPGKEDCLIVIGPMNRATPASSDVLLKLIEEPPDKLKIILWAEDLQGVLPTIISRCWLKWCYAEEECKREKEAKVLLECLLKKELAEALKVLEESKKFLEEVLVSVVTLISREEPNTRYNGIWRGIRKVLKEKNISLLLVSSTLLSGD